MLLKKQISVEAQSLNASRTRVISEARGREHAFTAAGASAARSVVLEGFRTPPAPPPGGAYRCAALSFLRDGPEREHATHCGEPDCSGVIEQLPGVIPRYGAPQTNAGRNTRNLLSQAGSRRRGESSPLPQAKTGNTGRGAELFSTSRLAQIRASNSEASVERGF